MVERSAAFTGDIPAHYDRALGPVLFTGYAKETARRVADLCTAGGRPASDILETAAGTGILSRALRSAIPQQSTLTVTDLNRDMIDIARDKFAADENIRFEVGDALALPYGNGSYDLVVCQFGLMFYPDQPASFVEAQRLLRRGGHYLFAVWDGFAYNPFARIADAVMGATFKDPPPFLRVPFGSHEIDPLKKMLLDAGFGSITIEVVARDQAVESWEHLAGGVIEGNPVVDQIKARDLQSPAQVEIALARAWEAEFGPSPATMPLQAIYFTATLR